MGQTLSYKPRYCLQDVSAYISTTVAVGFERVCWWTKSTLWWIIIGHVPTVSTGLAGAAESCNLGLPAVILLDDLLQWGNLSTMVLDLGLPVRTGVLFILSWVCVCHCHHQTSFSTFFSSLGSWFAPVVVGRRFNASHLSSHNSVYQQGSCILRMERWSILCCTTDDFCGSGIVVPAGGIKWPTKWSTILCGWRRHDLKKRHGDVGT